MVKLIFALFKTQVPWASVKQLATPPEEKLAVTMADATAEVTVDPSNAFTVTLTDACQALLLTWTPSSASPLEMTTA